MWITIGMCVIPREIRELIERFQRNREAYKSPTYNETQVRREFIDPLFKALGWDVDNVRGYAEPYKDVIHEDAIKVGGATKAPDYCFRIGGARKFFLEAKKPAVPLKDSAEAAYQLRRYAWSAKLPLSILTDFEELAVYDCRIRPHKTDKPSAGRTMYFNYTEYPDRWDELASIFSRDAVLKGSFDKYAESARRKRGTAEVDVEFLKEIERWRDLLARNFALRNRGLPVRQLNFAVQRTIDRVIFLRMCEDRAIEPYGQLQALLNGSGVYARLGQIFRRADERYNSSLFYFTAERGREPPDELTLSLDLDDRVLKEILAGLYYPESPYEFYVLPPEILGHVYEQFLGKVIRLTRGGQAKVEEKPEVRKAGGVYYTPTYIVDYIVKHTVGKLLEEKTPADVGPDPSPKRKRGKGATAKRRAARAKTRPLRVLDPACGSGSFLLGAYQHLLDWHRDWYVDDGPQGHPDRIYEGPAGQWRLTIQEKKRILLNNIYGVDIDPQAVEVTKLSLLLKVLEGETAETIGSTLRLFHERALPDLSDNIKCGNSLIGPDFYEGRQMSMFDEEERLRINAFDWHAEFPDVFTPSGRRAAQRAASAPRGGRSDRSRDREGAVGGPGGKPLADARGSDGARDPDAGFDAVIGNPPYIRIQNLREFAPRQAKHFKRQYRAASKGNYDVYVVFVERGVQLLSASGRLGFILPSKFLSTDYGAPLRSLLSHHCLVQQVVDFAHEQLFQHSTTYTCLLFLDRSPPTTIFYIKTAPKDLFSSRARQVSLPPAAVDGAPWLFEDSASSALLHKMKAQSCPLLDLPAYMSRGTSTGADDVFCLHANQEGLKTRAGDTVDIEKQLLRRPLHASDFSRYVFYGMGNDRLLFPYRVTEHTYKTIPESELRRDFPKAYAYLRARRSILEERKQFREWYAYSAPRNLHLHDRADVLVPLLADRGLCAPAPSQADRYCLMASAGFSVTTVSGLDPNYVLGLVNSRLLFWMLQLITNKFRGGWITCTKQYFGTLPIRVPDRQGDANGSACLHTVERVEDMLDLQKQLSAANTPHEKAALQRQIDATDRQIDQLVYELYGLTDDEIRIVEEATRA
jgi:hypothetical protein